MSTAVLSDSISFVTVKGTAAEAFCSVKPTAHRYLLFFFFVKIVAMVSFILLQNRFTRVMFPVPKYKLTSGDRSPNNPNDQSHCLLIYFSEGVLLCVYPTESEGIISVGQSRFVQQTEQINFLLDSWTLSINL